MMNPETPTPDFLAAERGPGLDMPPVGSSEQACKECRRRKARCNKALPTCDLCIKYRRHCLYVKHARTPLTRRHLTDVETRLERTEALLKQIRPLVAPHLRFWERQESDNATTPQGHDGSSFDFSSAPDAPQSMPDNRRDNVSPAQPNCEEEIPSPSLRRTTADDAPNNKTSDSDQHRMLETPPLDDFEWCEQDQAQIIGLSPDTIVGGEESSPIDGMASLNVNEREGGYLGVASGAALLRLLEPTARRRPPPSRSQPRPSLTPQPNPNRHVTETMIDAYFRLYHVSYPIIHEPTFRAQYSELIPRPSGPCWTALAYIVAALGVWTSSATPAETLDLALFSRARAMLDFNFLEVGNLSLVQALTLASNYQQKRDKPNSGYNYLGLAIRMAMGLGLHKEFQGWAISPLTMEIRRRVWWSLCAFDVGATITFSRPDVWPYKGVEVSLPLNVNDKDLTAASRTYPPESNQMTPYTAVATQARFHIAVHKCYDRVISKPFPSAEELLRMDTEHIKPWEASIPPYFSEETVVPPKYAFCQTVMACRLRNLRIIMYRPLVIRRVFRGRVNSDAASGEAYSKCLANADSTIQLIERYWDQHPHNRLTAWYCLYFLFQAVLIPCVCLRSDPSAPAASSCRAQITTGLRIITAMSPVTTSAERCHQVILDLCGGYLDQEQSSSASTQFMPCAQGELAGECPQTRLSSVLNMMWPNVPQMEIADVVMGDDSAWMEILNGGGGDLFSEPVQDGDHNHPE